MRPDEWTGKRRAKRASERNELIVKGKSVECPQPRATPASHSRGSHPGFEKDCSTRGCSRVVPALARRHRLRCRGIGPTGGSTDGAYRAFVRPRRRSARPRARRTLSPPDRRPCAARVVHANRHRRVEGMETGCEPERGKAVPRNDPSKHYVKRQTARLVHNQGYSVRWVVGRLNLETRHTLSLFYHASFRSQPKDKTIG